MPARNKYNFGHNLKYALLSALGISLFSQISLAQPVPVEITNLPLGVTDKIFQKGNFSGSTFKACSPKDIELDKTDPAFGSDYSECICKSDIHYPIIKSAPASIETEIKQIAYTSSCKGEEIDYQLLKKESRYGQYTSLSYTIPYISENVITIEFFNAGTNDGVVGHWNKILITANLKTGQIYNINDVFSLEDLPEINAYIRDELETIGERQESRNKEYLPGCETNHGETYCRNWRFDEHGVTVLFPKYEQSFGACAPPEVILPKKYIKNPDLLAELRRD